METTSEVCANQVVKQIYENEQSKTPVDQKKKHYDIVCNTLVSS